MKSLRPPISKARLEEMIEEATVDCHDESEQMTGWFTMLDENLVVPFETMVLGVAVTVERVDLNRSEHIVAVCARGGARQALPILDLPLPTPPVRRNKSARDSAAAFELELVSASVLASSSPAIAAAIS